MKTSNRSTLFKCVLTFSLALSMALVCGTAMGQDASDDSEFLLEDIIVTSEFREKAVQETPLSITAVSADMLEARNQFRLDQIATQAPNVSLRPAGASSGSSLFAYIRGVGQTDFNPSVEAGVGIYVDDVYYSTITGNILDLLDLERVEILRGPQGTLAGRNAIGGAIKLFTRKADGSDDGYASLTYGDYDRLDLKAAAGFTIVPDKLFIRLAGVSRSRDGYVTRYDYACHNNTPNFGEPGGYPTYVALGSGDCRLGTEGGQSMTAGRFSLRWVVSDNFQVDFSANIVNDHSEATPFVLTSAVDLSVSKYVDPVNGITALPIYFDNDGDGSYTAGVDVTHGPHMVPPAGSYYNYSAYIDDGRSTPDPFWQGGNPGQDLAAFKPAVVLPINYLEAEDYTLTLNWQISDNVSLLSVSSYREYLNTFGDDSDGSPFSVQQLTQRMDHNQFTQELRLNAMLWSGYADLTLGGFYLDQQTDEDARVMLNYSAFDFLHGPDLVPATSKAVYGQLGLHLSDRTDLTLGARYSEDEKSYTFQRHNPDGTLPQPPTGMPFMAGQPANSLVAGLQGESITYSSDHFDYRVALDYDINEDIMVYGQISTGYKAGGMNARPFYPIQIHEFDPEELINYEIGMKSTLWDQLRFNTSIFYNDYTEIQLPLTTCFWAPTEPVNQQVPCASYGNTGDAEVKGIELETVWRPTRALSVDFSFAWMDFEYTSLRLTTMTYDSISPYMPEMKWSGGVQYGFDLGDLGSLTPRIDVSWQDDVFTTAVNNDLAKIDDYYVVNGRLVWESKDAKWQAALEVTNLLDEYYFLTIRSAPSTAMFSGQPARPREFAFTIKRYWF